MFNTIQRKFSGVPEELAYRSQLRQHAKALPALMPSDQQIVNTIRQEGACVTSLSELGFSSNSLLLESALHQLKTMQSVTTSQSKPQSTSPLPLIFTVTDLPEFTQWAKENRLLSIVENYIGLPIAFQGVHLRTDLAGETPTATQLWHLDSEDRRILKVIIYLTDVEQKNGPFEYIPSSVMPFYSLAYWQTYYQNWRRGYLGIPNEHLPKQVARSAWKSCVGAAGTVIFVDTKRVFHHGTLRTENRSALFFVYTAKQPKRPELCTQYWDQTYARPKDYILP